MAMHTRTHGANARSQSWEDYSDDRKSRRGNWLPLDALDAFDDEEVYESTPRLQALPATRRQVFRPSHPDEEVAPTRPQPRVAPRSTREAHSQPREHAERGRQSGLPARTAAMAGAVAISLLGVFSGVSVALDWAQVKLDDLQYGRPRTTQMEAYVGHSEVEGVPSHFIAMNLNRRVSILELPGGDSTKATTIVGPYLFGQGEDLTPIGIAAQDINGDALADLIVSVKSEQLAYLNDGTTFKLMTPEERAALQTGSAAPAAAPESAPPAVPAPEGQPPAAPVEEAGK